MTSTTSAKDPEEFPLSQMEIGQRLRSARHQRGWTLQEVEIRSNGRWKAVVVGSYERGDRSLSLKGALQLANFYQIPLASLLGIENSATRLEQGELSAPVLDLRRVLKIDGLPERLKPIQNLALLICAKRRDWNGEILSLRATDSTTMALMTNHSEHSLMEDLRESQLLFAPLA